MKRPTNGLRFVCLLATAFAILTWSSAGHTQEKKSWSAKPIVTCKGHTERPLFVVLSPDGRLLVSTSDGNRKGELKIWDTASGKELAAPPWTKGYPGPIAFSGDSRRVLITGDSGRRVLLWDLDKKVILGDHGDPNHDIYAVTTNHDGSVYGAAGYDYIGVFQAKSGNSLSITRQKRGSFGAGTFTSNLQTYAVGNSQDIDLWDVGTGKEAKILGEHRGVVKRIAFSHDGKTIIAASMRSTGNFQGMAQIKFWDIATGKDRWTYETEAYQIGALALSRDQQTLAVLEYPELDGPVELSFVDVASRKQVFRLKDQSLRFAAPLFQANDRILVPAIRDDKAIQVWELSR